MLGKVIQNLLVMLVMFVISSCFLRETNYQHYQDVFKLVVLTKQPIPKQKGHKFLDDGTCMHLFSVPSNKTNTSNRI